MGRHFITGNSLLVLWILIGFTIEYLQSTSFLPSFCAFSWIPQACQGRGALHHFDVGPSLVKHDLSSRSIDQKYPF